MRDSKWRIVAIVLGAGVIAALVVVPALGGPSLKKLVKREVSKQLAKKTGAQGPPGQTGAPGPPGPPGPTAAGVANVSDPPATPDFFPSATSTNASVNAPSPGRLLVIFNTPGISVDCDAGSPRLGAYVDEVRVPETLRGLPENVMVGMSLSGITAATVSPGPHTIQIGADCQGGDVNGVGFPANVSSSLTGIVLGG